MERVRAMTRSMKFLGKSAEEFERWLDGCIVWRFDGSILPIRLFEGLMKGSKFVFSPDNSVQLWSLWHSEVKGACFSVALVCSSLEPTGEAHEITFRKYCFLEYFLCSSSESGCQIGGRPVNFLFFSPTSSWTLLQHQQAF